MDGISSLTYYNAIPAPLFNTPPPPPPSSFGKPSPEESRRDRIAIAAMQGLLSGGHPSCAFSAPAPCCDRLLAERAYEIADAMIAERGRR